MIQYRDWYIWTQGQVVARQFDHKTRSLEVVGQLPEGWDWTVIVRVGEYMDYLPLTRTDTGAAIELSAQQLALSGRYSIQLRGTQGELVRHTNVLSVYVPASLSGDANWPEIPSEFTQLEQRVLAVREQAAETAKQAETAAAQIAGAMQTIVQAKEDVGRAAAIAEESAVGAGASEQAAQEHRTQAQAAAALAGSYTSHPPVVGENGNWWTWNGAQYADSGKPSQGELTHVQGNTLYANALKGTASGAMIRLDDVSPLEHTVGVSVRSKNVIPYPYYDKTGTIHGVTYTVNTDGSVTLNGTSTIPFNMFYLWKSGGKTPNPLKDGIIYMMSGCDTAPTGVGIFISYTDEAGATKYVSVGNPFTWSNTYTIKAIYIQLANSEGKTFENITVYPQIEVGTTATEYESFVDPATVTVKAQGKNLIPFPYVGELNKVQYGITFIYNDDGTIRVKGTATQYVMTHLIGTGKNTDALSPYLKDGETYTVSVKNISGGSVGPYFIITLTNKATGEQSYVASTNPTFTVDKSRYTYEYLRLYVGGDLLNVELDCVVSVQLEMGTAATEHEAYRCAEYTTNEDGTCGVTSVAPTMTLTTDTDGVVMDCEYNRDINKAFEQLTQAIISMGGNV